MSNTETAVPQFSAFKQLSYFASVIICAAALALPHSDLFPPSSQTALTLICPPAILLTSIGFHLLLETEQSHLLVYCTFFLMTSTSSTFTQVVGWFNTLQEPVSNITKITAWLAGLFVQIGLEHLFYFMFFTQTNNLGLYGEYRTHFYKLPERTRQCAANLLTWAGEQLRDRQPSSDRGIARSAPLLASSEPLSNSVENEDPSVLPPYSYNFANIDHIDRKIEMV